MKRDLLSIIDLEKDNIIKIFSTTRSFKDNFIKKEYTLLRGKTLAMIFQKPSTRTRVSFEVGMHQLGGHPIFLSGQELQIKRGESFSDTAKILSRFVDGIMIRANRHNDIAELAKYSTVPVINGLSDREHPCQVLSDFYTIIEKLKINTHKSGYIDRRFWNNLNLGDLKMTFIGDGNNVVNSLLLAAAIFGMKFTVCTPRGYEPDKDICRKSFEIAEKTGARIELAVDPEKAVEGSDIIYTDVWVSMGEEEEYEKKKQVFSGYQVNMKLLKKAREGAVVMHCLPAHRGEEITADVLESSQSIVFDQAENRLHVQKAILLFLMNESACH